MFSILLNRGFHNPTNPRIIYKSLFTNHYDGMGSSLFWVALLKWWIFQPAMFDRPAPNTSIHILTTNNNPSLKKPLQSCASVPVYFFSAPGFETHLPVAGATPPFFDYLSDGTTTGQVLSVQQEPLPVGLGVLGFK